MAGLILALKFSTPAGAVDFFVTNVAQFNAAVPLAQAGDTLTLANGDWPSANLVFRGQGTPAQPITLRAQTSGQVFLTGVSHLQIGGSHLVVQGLLFTNGYPSGADVIEFRAGGTSLATRCRLTDCAVVDFNPPDSLTETKWVSLYGYSNQVDHCSFRGKRNTGTLMVVWLPSASSPEALSANYHQIVSNYFGPRPLNGMNGGEIIRVGDSSTSFNLSRTLVARNCFEACDGEIEIISSKSCENLYWYNTFVNCAGTLTLRHGNRCRVEGNYFFGNHKASTGGVRVIGEDQVVLNNYFQDLEGDEGYSALTIMQGLNDSPLNGYFQVKRAIIAFNTIVNCANSIVVGLKSTYSLPGTNLPTTLPPVDCVLANNLVSATKNKLVDQRIPPMNLVWQGNIMFGTALGITVPPGILQADPDLGQSPDGHWQPGATSPALRGAQGNYLWVAEDIKGRLRGWTKDVGCEEVGTSPPTRGPLTTPEVGPSWLQPLTLSLSFVNRAVVALRWQTLNGAVYQMQTSTNLVKWTDAGDIIRAVGGSQTWEELSTPVPTTPVPAKFYRIKKIAGQFQASLPLTVSMTNRQCASLRWNCVPGYWYQLQGSTNITSWQDLGPVCANGIPVMQVWEELLGSSANRDGATKFYRVKHGIGEPPAQSTLSARPADRLAR